MVVSLKPELQKLVEEKVKAGLFPSAEALINAAVEQVVGGDDLEPEESAALREAVVGELGRALAHYEQVVHLPIPDKLPLPLRVHRHEGEPCPRCGTTLEAVHFEDYVIAYRPADQAGGRVLKDRRLSRLLK